MRRNWFYVLLSLADGERHGLAIMRDVLELTENEIRLWPATLYGTLEELREHGWVRVESTATRASSHPEPGHKRWFSLTSQGRQVLRGEVARMDAIAAVARKRLLRAGQAP
jgi:DNA-binding PadR family transcriptional regulator